MKQRLSIKTQDNEGSLVPCDRTEGFSRRYTDRLSSATVVTMFISSAKNLETFCEGEVSGAQ